MSSTAHINAINLQVMAEDEVAADKASGTYDANKAADSKYYLWQSQFQTIPMGMDGNPEQFAAKLREALPEVNTLRLPFNEFSFNPGGTLHEQYERFLTAAAQEGFQIILGYFGGDVQRYGAGESADTIHDALAGPIHDGMSEGWTSMLAWLNGHPDVKDAVWGYEIANEPATYARGADADADGSTRFQELYAQHIIELAAQIDAEADGTILVGGWRYSATFDELAVGDVGGLTALDAIRAAVGDDLVWSSHLYPGWAGTKNANDADALAEILESHYAPLGDDAVLVTETNGSGGVVDNIAEIDSPAFLFVRSYEWFAEQGIGLTWFPGAETGASNFVVIDPNGSLRFLHQSSLAHGMNAYSLDESPVEHEAGEAISTELVASRVRNESYQPAGQTFDDTDGIAFGFGYGGDDTITGTDTANDLIYGGTGNDILIGGAKDDHLFGQYGHDTLDGGAGDDHLFGGDGDDRLIAGSGADQMTGGAGADTFVGGAGGSADIVDFDYAAGDRYESGGRIYTLDAMIAEGLPADVLGDGSETDLMLDEIVFHRFFERHLSPVSGPVPGPVDGTEGDDLIDDSYRDVESNGVGTLNDTVSGGLGNDTIDGGTGNDVLYGDEGDDLINGADGADLLFGGRGFDTLWGGLGDDVLAGMKGVNLLFGGPGNDTLDAGQNGGTLYGDEGADLVQFNLSKGASHTAYGGAGIDSFVIELNGAERGGSVSLPDIDLSAERILVDGQDLSALVQERAAAGDPVLSQHPDGVIVHLSDTNTILLGGAEMTSVRAALGLDGPQPTVPDEDDLTGATPDAAGAYPTQAADDLYGSDGDDLLRGGGGDDRIVGMRGADTLYGGSGSDTLVGQNGDDVLCGGSGDDLLMGSKGCNLLYGGDGNDRIETGYHTDTVDGGAGDDVIVADLSRGGDHVLTGGAGADVFVFVGSDSRISSLTITDFDAAEDRIEFGTFPNSLEQLTVAEDGDAVVLMAADGDSLRFDGMTLSLIEALLI